jgi:hypothetical protein
MKKITGLCWEAGPFIVYGHEAKPMGLFVQVITGGSKSRDGSEAKKDEQ